MSKIEINIIIDDGGITPEMQKIFEALAQKGAAVANDLGVQISTEEPAPEKKRKPYPTGDRKPEEVKICKVNLPGVNTETAPVEETPEIRAEAAAEEAPKYSIEEVRELAVSKGKQHREAVKAKITELGAANLVKLDPSHYETFVAFLNTLGD